MVPTGDIGRFDEGGFLTFIDRKKDVMRRNGENVSSFEVEAALRTHPAIFNVAVHETSGVQSNTNDIVAWLVLSPGAELTPQDLAEFLWDNVPYRAVSRYIKITGDLPLTPEASGHGPTRVGHTSNDA